MTRPCLAFASTHFHSMSFSGYSEEVSNSSISWYLLAIMTLEMHSRACRMVLTESAMALSEQSHHSFRS